MRFPYHFPAAWPQSLDTAMSIFLLKLFRQLYITYFSFQSPQESPGPSTLLDYCWSPTMADHIFCLSSHSFHHGFPSQSHRPWHKSQMFCPQHCPSSLLGNWHFLKKRFFTPRKDFCFSLAVWVFFNIPTLFFWGSFPKNKLSLQLISALKVSPQVVKYGNKLSYWN